MSNHGFKLVELKLCGMGVDDAIIEFTPGLNVITGPSDTGKSFIFECIDYVLGKSDSPKSIEEATGYSSVYLKVKVNASGEDIILHRPMNVNGKITAQIIQTGESIELKTKSSEKDPNNISSFLLRYIGIAGKRLKKNKRNVTQNLSFRTISGLVLVSEERIITPESPFLSGNTTSGTAEKSALNLLLTGNDDSELVAEDDPKISKAKAEAKLEIILGIIERYANSIPDRFQNENSEKLRDQIERLNKALEEIQSEIDTGNESFDEAETRRVTLRKEILALENRLRNIDDLSVRFALLDEQYVADIKRIEAISETAYYIENMKTERCPVCGSQSEHHAVDHANHNYNSEELQTSCIAEEVKTKQLNQDLNLAKNDLEVEKEDITDRIGRLSNDYDQVVFEIEDLLKPKHSELVNKLNELHELKTTIHLTIEKKDHLSDLNKLVEKLEASDDSDDDTDDATTNQSIVSFYDELAQVVLQELIDWNFPEANRVSFDQSYNVYDFAINGKPRNSHGKGVRAILYTSVITALFKYCIKKNMPHPGFLVIDSPLVVYREPDSVEINFGQDVKSSMYRSLSTSLQDEQVIIVENVEPPSDLVANVIHFTKSTNGRYGFIPAKAITEN